MSETIRTIRVTEAEESVLVSMIQFFTELGVGGNIEQEDFDSLSDKICEPAFWEYS